MLLETLAKIEGMIRPYLISYREPRLTVGTYSRARLRFLSELKKEPLPKPIVPPKDLETVMWGITFRSPIFNAAGMYKNGECYDLVASQGAGAYLGGSTTFNPIKGFKKGGIYLPFVPYPRSHAASNKLGLPNDGHEVVAGRIEEIEKVEGCPIGMSVASSPDQKGKEALEGVVYGLKRYEKAGVDFLELDENCPNVEHAGREGLYDRLLYYKHGFLVKRSRRIPVIVKLSNDTRPDQVAHLIEMLVKLEFDGVNFGNSSTEYGKNRGCIDIREKKLYNYFTRTFGGGVSGAPLRDRSAILCKSASQIILSEPPSYEFYIWRTGGIETARDFRISIGIGASAMQWLTGLNRKFEEHGNLLYKVLYEEILEN